MNITTAFISRCSKSRLRGSLAALLAVATLLATGICHASEATVLNAQVEATEEGYQLNADFDLQLTPAMQDAVRKGVALYFVVEFEITQGRWYWFDRTFVQTSRDRRVAYAPLTEQFRISTSGVTQNVSSFEEVKRSLSRVRSWTVAEKSRLIPGERYDAAIRIRLDTSRLPKPFQLNVLASKEWSLSSEWYRWSLAP